MKCVCINKPGEIDFQERELKPLKKGFARIKVKACAICATDLEVVEGRIPANYPIVLGHEWSGIVEEVSDDKYKKYIGKRVTGSNDVICGHCPACLSGNWRYCPDFKEIGFKMDGAYAEYVDVPEHGLVVLPDSLSFEEAALAEPLGVALGTWEKVEAKQPGNCIIYGAGPIGLCCLIVAKAKGMKNIIVINRSKSRLDTTLKLGADYVIATSECDDLFAEIKKYHPEGTDYIIECTGAEEAITNSLKIAKPGATIALAGYGRGKIMNIRIDDIHIKNLRVIGAGNNWNEHQKAIDLMATGQFDMKHFITNRIHLQDVKEGFRLAKTRPEGFIKAVFVFDEK